jgi:hypothetical protein
MLLWLVLSRESAGRRCHLPVMYLGILFCACSFNFALDFVVSVFMWYLYLAVVILMSCSRLYSYCIRCFFSKGALVDITNSPAESVKTGNKSSA